ncbi:ubiquitin-protein ligase [Saccharomycopsis crataegensis]|uniref:Ubiquitin-protein ligase n=1 Tax=Saccharomycopsis crataegensis TaxID=43959 RepID=A0AAV5QE47_9ASCO|nr:ubiquitin-protein ligase [Saccharomycopsis crataegensis]
MAANNSVFQSLLGEYGKFRQNGSTQPMLTETKELISYLKEVEQQLQQEIDSNGGTPDNNTKQGTLKENTPVTNKIKSKNYDYNQSIRSRVDLWKDRVGKVQKQSNNHMSKIMKLVDNKVYEFDLLEELEQFNPAITNGLKLTSANQDLINQTILNHVVRETNKYGKFTKKEESESNNRLVELLENQFNYSISADFKNDMAKLKSMIDSIIAIDEPDLTPAFEWCKAHSRDLQKIGSDIEFQLHELQFYLLYYGVNSSLKHIADECDDDETTSYGNDVHDTNRFGAYVYAKSNFGKFLYSKRSVEKIATASKLLTSTILSQELKDAQGGAVSTNPYSKMFAKNLKNYRATISQLVENFCQIHNLHMNSNLYLVFMASYMALPYIVKFNSVNKKLQRSLSTASKEDKTDNDIIYRGSFGEYFPRNRSVSMPNETRESDWDESEYKNDNPPTEWGSKDELPIGIDLPEFLQNDHPIFICPISRQETTSKNPPILLPCKHIISRESLNNLLESKQFQKRRRAYRSWLENDVFHDDGNENNSEAADQQNTTNGSSDGFDDSLENELSNQNYDFPDSDQQDEGDEDEDQEVQGEESYMENRYSEGYNNSTSSANAISQPLDMDDNSYNDNSYVTFRRFNLTGAPGEVSSARNIWRINSSTNRSIGQDSVSFKCPYCPQMCRKRDTKEVFFSTC